LGTHCRKDGREVAKAIAHEASYAIPNDLVSTITNSQMRYTPFGQLRWTNGAMPTGYKFIPRFAALTRDVPPTSAPKIQWGYMTTTLHAEGKRAGVSPLLARFISPDSIVPDPGNVQDWNRYGYVQHNPLKFVDPTGHSYQQYWMYGYSYRVYSNGAPGGGSMGGRVAGSSGASSPTASSSAARAPAGSQPSAAQTAAGQQAISQQQAVAPQVHKNSNQAVSRYGIYEIKVDGQTHKFGKADLDRVTQSTGLPTRIHQQVRKLEEANPGAQVRPRIVNDLGNVTTAQAKKVEKATLQNYYDTYRHVPPGNSRSFKPE
jgi:RHS repeat-associated protein